MKMPNGKLSRAVGVAAVAVVLLGASVLAVAGRAGHAGARGQGHGMTRYPGFPVAQVVGPPNPQAVVPGSGAFTLRVFGANFISSSVVNWNRQARATTFVSGHEVDAEILASDVATATAGTITVTNSTPGGPVTSSSWSLVEVHDPTAIFALGTERDYVTAGPPLLVGDVNGDGNLDLGMPTSPSAQANMQVFLGSASGRFTPGRVAVFKFYSPGTAAFGDFNNDGKLDLVFTEGDAHFGPPLALQVNLGNGDGTFTPGARVAMLQEPVGVVVGDFNQDGALDLVVNNTGTPLYLGNGDGTFSKGGHILAPSLTLVTGDFNGDGELDLVSETEHPGRNVFDIEILLGNGDGTVQKAQQVVTVASPDSVTPLLVTDLNGDGNLDIVYSQNNTQLGVLLGRGDGTFLPPVFYPLGVFGSFAAGDFNSDGNTDLIAEPLSNDLVLLLGNGDGTFQPAQTIKVPHFAGQFVTGDFNSDGLLDLAGLGSFLNVFLQK
jgi:FG-GAP-like repeat